ncbi:MAG: sugar O-acetyltransferase [Thermosynechococcaceae cyanobacterium]
MIKTKKTNDLSTTAPQKTLIKTLFGSIGDGFTIRPSFQCDYGSNIYAGDNLYINFDCVILDCNIVKIGNNCFLAPKVQIYTATHPLNPGDRASGWEYALPITIGNDVWIGGGAILCPGVTIGNKTVIGAGSVVTKAMPSQVVAAGNPCRVIRQL